MKGTVTGIMDHCLRVAPTISITATPKGCKPELDVKLRDARHGTVTRGARGSACSRWPDHTGEA
jgi:hypothetical protein